MYQSLAPVDGTTVSDLDHLVTGVDRDAKAETGIVTVAGSTIGVEATPVRTDEGDDLVGERSVSAFEVGQLGFGGATGGFRCQIAEAGDDLGRRFDLESLVAGVPATANQPQQGKMGEGAWTLEPLSPSHPIDGAKPDLLDRSRIVGQESATSNGQLEGQ